MPTDLDRLEVDVVLLAILNAVRAFLADKRISYEIERGAHPFLAAVRAQLRSQVVERVGSQHCAIIFARRRRPRGAFAPTCPE